MKPRCLPSDWIEEYQFDSQTGEILIGFLLEKSDVKLIDEIVLDFNIKQPYSIKSKIALNVFVRDLQILKNLIWCIA